ncbi:MAG TPA: MliC family protein [Candidatus Paceibacterota bacterium]|nr:MliC family protein [Candidatus Paceibacterota bacterium]
MTPDQLPSLRGRATVTTVLIVVILIALCLVLWMYRNTEPVSRFFGSDTETTTPGVAAGNTVVSYSCDEDKSLSAEYIDGGPASSTPDGRPVPTGAVELTFSDGTMLRLPQTLSASGIRYANADESLIFWSKGDTAFIQQGIGTSQTETYSNCVAQ